MEPLIYIVAILGCADGGQLCEPVAREPARYESQTACLAAVQDALLRHDDAPYPEIVARCEPRGLQTAAR